MFYALVTGRPLLSTDRVPTDLFEGDTMFNPKWGVLAVALGVFALAAAYSVELGLAVGLVLASVSAIALWAYLRSAFQQGESRTDRSTLALRFSRLGRNRRAAQATADLRAKARSDTPKGP